MVRWHVRPWVGIAFVAGGILGLVACGTGDGGRRGGGPKGGPNPSEPNPSEPSPKPGVPAEGSESQLTRRSIDQKKFPDAVCNDGSTPVFYVRRGAQRDKWVVWFKGGSACADQRSCDKRERDLKSSDPWMSIDALTERGNPSSADGGADGILSSNPAVNPDFHSWNHVYLVYCTSDNWSGDRAATAETFGLHFRGHQVTTAMFDALMDESIVGPSGIDEAAEVILAGSSAGAAGLRSNLDRLAGTLPKSARVVGFSDAGITPSVTPQRGDAGEDEGWINRLEVWGSVPDESCAKAHPGDKWKCLEGRYLMLEKHLQTPTFYHQDQRDPVTMGDFDRNDPTKVDQSRQASNEIRDYMSKLEGGFCPAEGFHIILNDARFNRERCNGLTVAEVFGNWYFDRPGPKLVVDDGGSGGRREGRGGGQDRNQPPDGGYDTPDGRPPVGPGGRRNPSLRN